MQVFIEIYCHTHSKSVITEIISDEDLLKEYELTLLRKRPIKIGGFKSYGIVSLLWDSDKKILSLTANSKKGNNPYATIGMLLSYLKTRYSKDIKTIVIL